MEKTKKIKALLSFVLAIGIIAGALKVLNWLPMAIQDGYVREYPDIDSMQSRLKIRDVYVPTYFTEGIKWPPSRIWAQTRPYHAIVMEFRNTEKGEVSLIISQVAARARFIPDDKIHIEQVRERTNYSLKGRKALLEVGFGPKDERCSRISWTEGQYRITLVMKAPPFELIKISESMLRK